MSLKTKILDADTVGLSEHFDEALTDVLVNLNEQEMGNRKEGAIVATFKVSFKRNRDGVTYDVTSTTKAPGRIITEGGSAYLHDGQLQTIDARQQELPLDSTNVTPLNNPKTGE
tara:strand:+ start:175 stop:516 length:342 start_codon:yes stop_codon:yes gene_type:complete